MLCSVKNSNKNRSKNNPKHPMIFLSRMFLLDLTIGVVQNCLMDFTSVKNQSETSHEIFPKLSIIDVPRCCPFLMDFTRWNTWNTPSYGGIFPNYPVWASKFFSLRRLGITSALTPQGLEKASPDWDSNGSVNGISMELLGLDGVLIHLNSIHGLDHGIVQECSKFNEIWMEC